MDDRHCLTLIESVSPSSECAEKSTTMAIKRNKGYKRQCRTAVDKIMFRKGFENGLPPADHQSKTKYCHGGGFYFMFPRTRSGDRAILSFIFGSKGFTITQMVGGWRGGRFGGNGQVVIWTKLASTPISPESNTAPT